MCILDLRLLLDTGFTLSSIIPFSRLYRTATHQSARFLFFSFYFFIILRHMTLDTVVYRIIFDSLNHCLHTNLRHIVLLYTNIIAVSYVVLVWFIVEITVHFSTWLIHTNFVCCVEYPVEFCKYSYFIFELSFLVKKIKTIFA